MIGATISNRITVQIITLARDSGRCVRLVNPEATVEKSRTL